MEIRFEVRTSSSHRSQHDINGGIHMFYGEQKILSMLKPQFCYFFRIIILFSEQSKQLHTITSTMKLATLASAAAVLLSAFAGTVSASVSSTLHVVCCVLTDGWHDVIRCVLLLVYVDVDVVVVVPGSPMF